MQTKCEQTYNLTHSDTKYAIDLKIRENQKLKEEENEHQSSTNVNKVRVRSELATRTLCGPSLPLKIFRSKHGVNLCWGPSSAIQLSLDKNYHNILE